MDSIYQIPERFWGLFQSQNRYIYIESLMLIYEEYLYNDYFLTKDTCIQILADHFAQRCVDVSTDEIEEEENVEIEKEPVASKILNRLLYFRWLKKIEDYASFKTNIAIPDYASMFIDVFNRLNHPEESETDLYIQNVYTNIYSFYHDKKAGIELLKTARINISKLNRSLQDLLHNMDEFFSNLLSKQTYETLLTEHLEVFVEDAVNKKYSLLKTNDNFYIYKNDIRTLLRRISEDEERLFRLQNKMMAEGKEKEDSMQEILEVLDAIERGILNMEKRIMCMDLEYSKYVRATVSRLEYLLNKDDNTRGNIIELLHIIGNQNKKEVLTEVSKRINFHDFTLLSQDSFYKKKKKRVFEKTLQEEEVFEELTREQVLRMNKVNHRYTSADIEHFVLDKMESGKFTTDKFLIASEKEFELLILAYDYGIRKNSPYWVKEDKEGVITSGKYRYPHLTFRKK